jgi:Flp pilus assembly secretin CpaC
MGRLASHIAAGFAGAILLTAAQAAVAWAGTDIDVSMNQAKILKLTEPADTIVVGNPNIADASVQDDRTIVLTGKGFGVTNLVVMDKSGSPIIDAQVIVSRHEADSVRVYRRAQVQTLSCTPYCEGAYKSPAEKASEQEMNGAAQ